MLTSNYTTTFILLPQETQNIRMKTKQQWCIHILHGKHYCQLCSDNFKILASQIKFDTSIISSDYLEKAST